MTKVVHISVLLNKTITKILNNVDVLSFFCSDGSFYQMRHDQSCCEDVTIDDICGELDCLIGSPILVAEESTNRDIPKNKGDESFTWTFYKLATFKGYVDIRWYGRSNGYYSEAVNFIEINEGY
jgi:hypothetical protein